jgi:hypothetical protein
MTSQPRRHFRDERLPIHPIGGAFPKDKSWSGSASFERAPCAAIGFCYLTSQLWIASKKTRQFLHQALLAIDARATSSG